MEKVGFASPDAGLACPGIMVYPPPELNTDEGTGGRDKRGRRGRRRRRKETEEGIKQTING